jgi:hypothetical protein
VHAYLTRPGFAIEAGASHGLFTRVVANGDGSELTFTFIGDASEEQRAILAVELQTVRSLCER